MADPASLLSSDQPGDLAEYKPLSGLAVASFILGGLSALALLVLGVLSFFAHSPLILPPSALLIPVAGAVLALVGAFLIRRSEGARTGLGLTRWGWWLSILSCLLYLAFSVGSYFAVSFQAQAFIDQWFKKVQQGKIAAAFLDTKDPSTRLADNPDDPLRMMIRYGIQGDDGKRGDMGYFAQDEVVRLIQQAGPEAKFKSLGLRGWDYKEGGYLLQLNYQIITQEGTFEVLFPVRSKEGKELKGRQWWITWSSDQMLGSSATLTNQGVTMLAWRKSARSFANLWIEQRNQKKFEECYLDTLDPSQEWQENCRILLEGLSADGNGCETVPATVFRLNAIKNPLVRRETLLAGYPQFAAGGLVNGEGFETLLKDFRTEIPRLVKEWFLQPARLHFKKQWEPIEDTHPKLVGTDRVQMRVNIEMLGNPSPGDAKTLPFRADAKLVLESNPGLIDPDREPRWRLIGLEMVRGGVPSQAPKGPPPGGMTFPGK